MAKWLRELICQYRAQPFDHFTGVGSSPTQGTCETSQGLLVCVPGGFSWGSPVFTPPTDWPVSYEQRNVKLN